MKNIIYFLLMVICSTEFINCHKQDVNFQTAPQQQNSITLNEIPDKAIFYTKPEKKESGELPILFSHQGLYGYLNHQLQIIVPPIYANGYNYTDYGYALVSIAAGDGFLESRILDCEGNIVFKEYNGEIYILYDDILSYTPNGEKYPKIIKFRDNILVANASGISASAVGNDIIILVRFTPDIEKGFINLSGNRILPDFYLKRISRGFKEERAVVILDDNLGIRIIDINGNFYGNLHFFRTGWYFSEGLLPAETTDGKTGYINLDGDFAFLVPIVADIPEYDESPLNATDFKDGFAIIQTILEPPTWKVINNKGEFVSDDLPLFLANAFADGLSRVKTNDAGYGYININGEMVIEPIFEKAYSFNNGYARIIYNGRDGIIDTKGEVFWSDEIIKNQKEE